MTERITPTKILRIIRDGPASGKTLTAQQVKGAARTWPERYDRALVRLNFLMLEKQYQSSGRNILAQYERFIRPWRRAVDSPASEYFMGTVDAYSRALKLGFQHLDWLDPKHASEIAAGLDRFMPDEDSIAGIPWRLVKAQVQSTFSREAAAETFQKVRQHRYVSLVPFFYWDTGALTYYGNEEIQKRKGLLPSLSDMQSWNAGVEPRSDKSILVSVDANFFRIYGPMLLFNAQQIPHMDFVILLCTSADEAEILYADAQEYLSGLSALNRQDAPRNVSFRALEIPRWVANDVTFYASARFLALPGLLEEYETVYSMDADLFLVRDPASFLKSQASTTIGFPQSDRLLGVPPWRRFMAGNFVARTAAKDSVLLQRHLDYLSVGLTEPKSWMLDQNALSYAVEGAAADEFRPLPRIRPAQSGNIMADWEKNYKATQT